MSQPIDREFRFASVSEEDVIKIINNLKPKYSCGCDEISVKLIKFAKKIELCKPITTIVNQCLETGIFPDKLKIVSKAFDLLDHNILLYKLKYMFFTSTACKLHLFTLHNVLYH